MMTIDIGRVLPDANTDIGLSTRRMVERALEIDVSVSHIESRRWVSGRRYVTVEMGSGEWLTVPEESLISR